MASKQEQSLTKLVKLLNSGVEFYRHAEHEVASHDVATIFEAMAFARESSLAQLQPYVTQFKGGEERGHAPSVELRKRYATTLAALKRDPQGVYINQLEEIEDATLHAIDDALRHAESRTLTSVLTETRNRMSICHEKMHRLQSSAA